MWSRLTSHVILVITLGAFLGAGMMQGAWPVQAAASPVMTMVTQPDGDARMPCEGMAPTCVTDLGCIFMIGLPTVSLAPTMTRLCWKRIRYGDLAQIAGGLTPKPALDPPMCPG